MPVRYAFTAPTKGHNGLIAGVRFTHGHAEATDPPPGALEYFRRRGYRVEPLNPAPPTETPPNGQQAKKPAARSRARAKPRE